MNVGVYENNEIKFFEVLPLDFKGYEAMGLYGFIKDIAFPCQHLKHEQDPSYRMPFYWSLCGIAKEHYIETIQRGDVLEWAKKWGEDSVELMAAQHDVLAALQAA